MPDFRDLIDNLLVSMLVLVMVLGGMETYLRHGGFQEDEESVKVDFIELPMLNLIRKERVEVVHPVTIEEVVSLGNLEDDKKTVLVYILVLDVVIKTVSIGTIFSVF